MDMPPPDWSPEHAPAAGDDGGAHRTWVYRQVLDAIRDGRLLAGARLPSARRLAADWRVPRGAVDAAFAQLQAEGLVERRVGHGSFVARHLRASALQAVAAPPATPDAATERVLQRLALLGRARTDDAVPAGTALLRPGIPDTASFPLAAWRREVARALADGDRSALSYGEGAGLPALRIATARHLSLTRSIDCRPEQVLIVASPLHAVELAAQVLLEPGDRVCVDDPGLVAAARALDVPLDDEGFDVDFARRHGSDAVAVLLQPLNQVPTGRRTSAARQHALLDWADACGAWVIEHDVLGEIVHDAIAPPPLMAADRNGRVLYVGSFSPLTFPSLRLAYLVLPESLIDVFAAVRGLMGDHCPVVMQAALAGFIDAGHLAGHLRQVRRLYRERRDALRSALAQHLPDIDAGPLTGGLHACLPLPARFADVDVVPSLRARGVRALALSSQIWQAREANGLVVGYGADAPAAIDEAVRRIAAVLGA
jgi:GntR family transcriptional regulator/MocR family aminotransferase